MIIGPTYSGSYSTCQDIPYICTGNREREGSLLNLCHMEIFQQRSQFACTCVWNRTIDMSMNKTVE